MFQKNNRLDVKRISIIRGSYILILALFVFRLYMLQISPSEKVEAQVNNYQTEVIAQMKYRIFDTNGKDLLKYKKNYIVILDTNPFMLNNYEETLKDLMALNFIMKSEVIDFNYSDILKQSGKIYYKVSKDTYNKVNELTNIKGIYTYVYDEVDNKEAWSSSNILTNIEEDKIVINSLEEDIYNYVKDNHSPQAKFYLNDLAIYNDGVLEVINNNNIKLTINSTWEEKISEVLNKEDYKFLDNIGVIVSEAESGKIRAMVQKNQSMANVNLGIEQLGYEPGSIFKVLTETIALDMGIIKLDDVFSCVGEICEKNGVPHGHGELTVQEALNISCNDIFAKIGNLIGYDNMIEYLENMNMFESVLNIKGINRTEALGVKPTEENSMNNISIGQTILVTPIQMSGIYNSIVNDGIYVKPTFVEAIIDENENIVKEYKNEEKRIFSEISSKIVRNSMIEVISEGSGFEARVLDTTVGGKTGTSTGNGGTNHGWFAGYFEYENSKYTIVVIAPNIGEKHPDGRDLGGGNTGAPIFRDVVNSIIKK